MGRIYRCQHAPLVSEPSPSCMGRVGQRKGEQKRICSTLFDSLPRNKNVRHSD